MKKIRGLLLRLAVTGACLTYAMWGVDFSRLLEVVRGFGLWPIAVTVLGVLLSIIPSGARMSFLTDGRVGVAAGLRAVFLGLALNNILPARMGEAGKAFYLAREGKISMGRALEAVFWERFSDLNALLAVGAFAMAFMREWTALYPLAGVVCGLWCFLFLYRVRPGAAHGLLRLVPFEKARLVFSETLLLLRDKLRVRFLGLLGGSVLLIWAGYLAVYVLAIRWAAGLDLSLLAIATVFAVTTMGFAIPAAPGGMGVYEAAFVWAMSWFGVGREEAFAVGFTLHMIQYVPVTLVGLGVMAAGGVSLGALRAAGKGEGEESTFPSG